MMRERWPSTSIAAAIRGSEMDTRTRGLLEAPALQGTVLGIARGITDHDNKDGPELLSSINPTFTWVRLAQRIPVGIYLTHVPPDVLISAGMTCTVVMKEGAAPDRTRHQEGSDGVSWHSFDLVPETAKRDGRCVGQRVFLVCRRGVADFGHSFLVMSPAPFAVGFDCRRSFDSLKTTMYPIRCTRPPAMYPELPDGRRTGANCRAETLSIPPLGIKSWCPGAESNCLLCY
jgi:hypothetical protein